MLAALTLGLLLFAPATVEVVVMTLPTRGEITLMLNPTGRAELRREPTVTRVKIEIDRLPFPSSQGQAFNTYVVWAVSPEGVFQNLGELAMDREKARLEATTPFEQVGLLITAEPHYMVDRPSAAFAFRTQAPRGDDIRRMTVAAQIGLYDYSTLQVVSQPGASPLIAEARAAFQIARIAGADRWAEAEFRLARVALDTMEEMVTRASPFDIVSQTSNETIRRSQIAVTAAREKRASLEVENARSEIETLRQEQQSLTTRFQQLMQQQNVTTSQLQRLQNDVTTSNREAQRITQERDQTARELSDLKKKQEELQSRLIMPLREEFFDVQSSMLTAPGREALARLCGIAEAVTGPVRLNGPASDALFEAARQYLTQAGIVPDRIILKR